MYPQTFVQKILSRSAKLKYAPIGTTIDIIPDRILSHDNTAAIAKIFSQLGIKEVYNPKKLVITLDHAAPPPTPFHARNHDEVRKFVLEQNISHFFEIGRGICHQVISEEALILPGEVILGADSHTTHFGWLGAFGSGIGRTEVAALWATDQIWMRVPESILIQLEGKLNNHVSTKDLCLYLIGKIRSDGGLYSSIEFAGKCITDMSIDSRMVIPNMMAEAGAKNAYLPPDNIVFEWLANKLDNKIDAQELKNRAIYPDEDAKYSKIIKIDLSNIDPQISLPHNVDNTHPVSNAKGQKVHQVFIGTCTNGRLEDISIAAKLLKNKNIAKHTRLLIIPASSEILNSAIKLGYISTLLEAGATLGTPGCGPCMGNHMGIPSAGETCLSTGNRNFRGRMGEPDANIYLAGPAVAAATALTGVITDPREIA